MKEFLSILRSSPLFAGISDREILQTLEIFGAKIKNFKKDEFILRAGEPVEGVGVLLSGSGLILREDFGATGIFSPPSGSGTASARRSPARAGRSQMSA